SAADGVFAELALWLVERIGEPVKVAQMAEQVNMSERSFHRKFSSSVGVTPAKYFENLRLEHAKTLIEAKLAVKSVAQRSGFQSESAFRSAFRHHFGVSPNHHAKMQVG
ncbi:MAG: helix-turn-helix domain-containing protein, partial [Undibacterium sp.]|nr:helix-turn-helix domain-containing protein [Undibacterium sp.]